VRRVVQALLYEAIAVAIVTPVISWTFAQPGGSALALSGLMSAVALAWNYGFNAAYERWEAGHTAQGRTLARRLVHGAAFEGGLTLLLVPLMALWLSVSMWHALVADVGLLVFFFVYTVAYTWAFDRAFGLPGSAGGA
jgi:uncharacterized membrane protein